MLGAVLLGGEEPLDVALGRLGRAGDRAEAGAAVLAGDEPLGRGADERDPVELEQEQVRRRVDAPQRPVDVERRRRGRPLGPLRRERTGRRRPRRCAPSPTRPSRCSGRDRASAGSARACRAALGARRCPTRGVPAISSGVAGEHLGDAGTVVEADERVAARSRGSPGSRGRPRAAAPSARAARRGRRRDSRRSAARARSPRRSRRCASRLPSTSCARAGPARPIRG